MCIFQIFFLPMDVFQIYSPCLDSPPPRWVNFAHGLLLFLCQVCINFTLAEVSYASVLLCACSLYACLLSLTTWIASWTKSVGFPQCSLSFFSQTLFFSFFIKTFLLGFIIWQYSGCSLVFVVTISAYRNCTVSH